MSTTSVQDIDRYLQPFHCFRTLQAIGITSRALYESHEPVRNLPVNIGGSLQEQTTSQWGLAYLAYRTIVSCSDDAEGRFVYRDVLEAHSLYGRLGDPFDKDKDAFSFLGRISQQQFPWQEYVLRHVFARYYLLLCVVAEERKIEIGLDIPRVFRENFELDIRDFLMIGFSVFVRSIREPFFRRDRLFSHSCSSPHMKSALTEKNTELFLRLVCGDYSTIRELGRVNNVACPAGYEKYHLNPLTTYPVVIRKATASDPREADLVVPNIVLLFKRFTEGMYWDIRNLYRDRSSQDFTNAFGHIFGEYVGRLLKLYFGAENVEPLAGSDSRIADWVVWIDDICLIVECKSSLMGLAVRQTYRSREWSEWLKKRLAKGVSQVTATEKHLAEQGRLSGKETVKFIVLQEELFLVENPIFKEKLRGIVKEEYGIETEFYMVDIRELELMHQAVARRGFRALVTEKKRVDRDPRPGEGHQFMSVLKTVYPDKITNSWLDETFDKFFDEFIGGAEMNVKARGNA